MVHIFCPLGFGHRPKYLSLLLRHAAAHGLRAAVTYPAEAEADPAFRLDVVPWLADHKISDGANADATRVWKSILASEDYDMCVNLDADPMLFSTALVRCRSRVKLLVMRPWPHPGLDGKFRFFGKRLGALACRARGVEVLALGGVLNPGSGGGWDWLDDPLLLPPDALLGERPRHGFTLVGTVTRRKNLGMILQAWESMGHEAPPLTIAGRADDSVASELQRLARLPQVRVLDQYVSDAHLLRLLETSTATLCIYDNAGSSGIAQMAVVTDTPIISLAGSTFSEFVERHGLGVSVGTPNALASVVRDWRPPGPSATHVRRELMATPERFAQRMLRASGEGSGDSREWLSDPVT